MFANLVLLIFIEALLIGGMLIFRFCQTPASRPIIKPLYIGAVLLVPPAGLMLQNYNYFFALLVLAPFAARGNGKTLACLYLALLLQFPAMQLQYVIGPVFLGGVSAIAALSLGALLALFGVRRRERRTPVAVDLCAWGIFLIFFFSQSRGLPVTGALRQLQSGFFAFMAPYLIVSRTLRTRDEAMEAMLVFTWSAFLNAVVASFEAVRGWPLYQLLPISLHVPAAGQGLSATLAIRAGFLRAQGPVANPTTLGIVLAIAIAFAPGLKRFFRKPQIWAIYGGLLLGLIVTQSRGAWIGAAAGYMMRLLFQRRYGPLSAFLTLAVFLWVGTAVLASEGSQVNQLLGRSGAGEQTAEYRSNLLHRGIEEIEKHPITGQLPDQLQISMADMRQGEGIIDFVNSHLFIGLVAGVEGLLLWLYLWIYPVLVALRAKRRLRSRTNQVPLELPASAIMACFIALLFTSPIDRNPALVALSMGFAAVLVRTARRGGVATRKLEAQAQAEARPRELVRA